jgi:hypothetical protein
LFVALYLLLSVVWTIGSIDILPLYSHTFVSCIRFVSCSVNCRYWSAVYIYCIYLFCVLFLRTVRSVNMNRKAVNERVDSSLERTTRPKRKTMEDERYQKIPCPVGDLRLMSFYLCKYRAAPLLRKCCQCNEMRLCVLICKDSVINSSNGEDFVFLALRCIKMQAILHRMGYCYDPTYMSFVCRLSVTLCIPAKRC